MSDDLPTSIRLSKALKTDLQRFAKAQGTSITWLIRHVLEQWIDWRKKQKQVTEQEHERAGKRD